MSRQTRVLHVDDDAGFASLTASTLEGTGDGFEVVVENAAGDALERLADGAGDIDCIVSDYEMPGIDGLEFLQAVRTDHPDLPFVLFTGKGSEEVASDAFSAGATDYLQKGPGIDQFELLAKRIENVVSRWRARTDYRHIFEDATDGITVHDPDTAEILDVNRRFCEMVGYDREDLLSASIGEFSAADRGYTQRRADEHVARVLADGEQVFEWVVTTAGGDDLPVEIRLKETTLRGRNCVLAIARDISDRKARERKLRREQAFVESLFDAIPDLVYALDETGNIVRWNDHAVEVTGYSDEEIGAMDATEMVDGEDVDRVVDAVGTVVSERRSVTLEVDVVTKDGTSIPYELVGAPLIDDAGDLRGIVGAGRDVSGRLARERELERYEQIVDAVGDAVFELDHRGAFTEVNEYMAEILGYEAEDLLGEHLAAVVSPADLETAKERQRALLAGEADYATFELTAMTADGEPIPCEVRIALAPERAGTDRRGTVGVVRDVSDRKERERELERQNQRLEEFASIVSHDLKNPLTVAKGRIGLARADRDSEDLEIAASTLDRMETLVDRTLTLAREGRTVGETQPVDLSGLAEAAWATGGGPEATLRLGDLPEIEADPDRLRHLFENLYGNAVEHGAGDATVTVGPLDGGFFVADDGPGIPADERDSVLEAGYTTAQSGTGLGLAIVRRIAEAHGWTVDVLEGADGGARFEFTDVDRVA